MYTLVLLIIKIQCYIPRFSYNDFELPLSDLLTLKHLNTLKVITSIILDKRKKTLSLMISEIYIEIIYYDIYSYIFFLLITNV